jgi:chemotaxis protein CheX
MIDVGTIFDTFVETTQIVIKSMAPEVEMARGDMCASDKNMLTADVSGMLGITGEVKLSLSVSFSKEAIFKIYAAVFPEEAMEATIFHMGDMVGEITNMIAGNFKNILSELDISFESAIPTIVVGSQQVYHPSGSITRVIPFFVDGFHMFIEVSIRES